MTEGFILLVTDRIDRGEAVRDALNVAVDVRVTGPDFLNQDMVHLLDGRIDGVVTDISFKREASMQSLHKLLRQAGIKVIPVHYRGAPPAVTDLLGGHADFMFSDAPFYLEHIKAGKLIPLAVGTPQRFILEQLERFSREVMPTFKAQARVPAAAG